MSTVSIFSPLPTRLLPDLNIWVTLRMSYKKQEMLILCEDMFFFGGVRVPIYSLFVLCLGPNVAGSVCPSIHFSLCVLGPMLPDLCAHLFTFRSVSWAQCCRVRVPIYSLFVLCLGPNVACVSSLSILDFPNVYFVENNYNCNIIITTFNLLLALPKEKKRRFSNLFTVNVLD